MSTTQTESAVSNIFVTFIVMFDSGIKQGLYFDKVCFFRCSNY